MIGEELDADAIGQETSFFLQFFKVLAVVFSETPFLGDEDLTEGKEVSKKYNIFYSEFSPFGDLGT